MVSKSRSNIRLEEAVTIYLNRIENEGQASTSIRTAYYALERFKRALAEKHPRDPNPWVHHVTPDMADDYCFGPSGIRRGVGSITFNRYRSVLKVFFDYALLKRWADINPFDAIGAARPDAKKPPLMLNAGELVALLEHCASPVERIACSLGMNTGMRANDIRHLKIFDASLASGEIQTEIRKTRKLDVKPMTADLHREMVRWLDTYAELTGLSDRGALPNDWLLVPTWRMDGPRMRLRTGPWLDRKGREHDGMHTHPWRLVQRPLARMGYPIKGTGFHTLRRSSARAFFEMLRASGEGRDHALMIVQDFLNHSDTKMTQHYLGLNQERAIRNTLLKDKSFLSVVAQAEQARVGGEATEVVKWHAM